MKRLRPIPFLFFAAMTMAAVSFCPVTCPAQGQRFIFERIKQLASIPDVFSMDTDEYGRLWYSSWGRGVFCYDGYTHTRYMTDADNPNSIINDRVYDIVVDGRQRVWVGTLSGLNCIDRKRGQVRRFPSVFDSVFQFQSLYEDRSGTIWVGSSNLLMRYDEASGQLAAIPLRGDFSRGRCHAFYEDKNGTLWACRNDGLFRFSADRSYCERISLQTPEGTALNITSLLEDSRGKFLMGSYQGLFFYDRATNQLSQAALPDSMAFKRILAIHETSDGTLWAGLHGVGLLRWNVAQSDFQLFKNNPLDPGSIPSNFVYSITDDPFGNLWIGTHQEVSRLNLTTQPFSLWPINSEDPNSRQNSIVRLAEDVKGGLLVRTVEGLYYLEKLGTPPLPLLIDGKKILPDDFCTGPDGTVWAVTGDLYQWNVDSRSFSRFDTPLEPGKLLNLEIDRDDPNIFWFGTPIGLMRFNRQSDESQPFVKLIPAKYAQYVRNFVDDGRGSLWLDLPSFLVKFDKKSYKTTLFNADTLPPHQIVNNEILDIQAAPDGWVWVTSSAGITRIDPSSGRFYNMTRHNGLPDNVVPTVLFDRQNNTWIVSPEQIIRREASGALRNFDISTSIQTFLWTRGRCELRDGRLLFAGAKGILLLDPLKVEENQAVSTILLTRFETTDKEKSSKLIPEYLQFVQLSYEENNFNIEWAGIQTARSKDLRYECKLEREGQTEDWVQKGKGLQAVYTNMPPGAYTFKVRVIGSSKPELLLKIAISAPWWQSTWFKMLVLAMLATAAYLLWLIWENQRKLRQQKVLAEQNAHYKTRFLANMSHEIRTPMNAILGLSRLLTESTLPPKQATYADAIRQSSENLLVIVNDVLDQAKIESGKFRFQHKPFDLDHIVQHLQNTLGFKAEEKGLEFQIHIEKGTPTLLIGDPVRLSQILTNLLGNALKFTENGFVKLVIDGEQQVSGPTSLTFLISDSGIGIAEEQLQKVFESFQQADDAISSNYGGTGLGLSITKQLVEQQQGTIALDSSLGVGTSITVSLPFELDRSSGSPERTSVVGNEALKGLKILLVEDTFFNQILATELLKSRIPDVSIEVAENGQVALEKLASNGPFDLVLMDVKMPVMNGLEATRRLRLQPQWATLPVIALTANAVPEELEKCQVAGMNAWVTKPIDTEDLFATINRILKTTQS